MKKIRTQLYGIRAIDKPMEILLSKHVPVNKTIDLFMLVKFAAIVVKQSNILALTGNFNPDNDKLTNFTIKYESGEIVNLEVVKLNKFARLKKFSYLRSNKKQ